MRIHSRLPVVIPARITEQLCERLAKSPLKIIFVNHINHANEIDNDFKNAMNMLKKSRCATVKPGGYFKRCERYS